MSSTKTSSTSKSVAKAKIYWAVPATLVAALAAVFAAKWLIGLVPVADFIRTYPGHTELPQGTPEGMPGWLSWQHFLNAFFLLLIIRSGWQVRTTTKPPAYWTRNNKGLLRTKKPPTKISLELWFHLTLDFLWVLNGLVFMVLLVVSGRWGRVVPTQWEVFPNALSALIQYASLNWPTENGWVNYNSLQVLAYFTVVFIAAPLALLTGLRMSPVWPRDAQTINKFYPIDLARAVHFPVMIFFVAFVVVHVFLVFATGVLRNLNHMYSGSDDEGWLGLILFSLSLVVMMAAWFAARPLLLRPVASLTGKISR
ncbi:cytochrome b/b6 domain-containing protein [Pseudarthrobacter sp. PvP004]|uniref:cytochrome b/b6 domain-containing protein n=1 Tax=Pseudarthrobacter sp. PvP004 TaxID=2817850 RepID=UPI001AE7D36D|nr:cytochrome b/b6 domain-containing protein [Pseudarthrobacter sp. PvP004]